MSALQLPSSYYAVLVTFAVFFFFLNAYILTLILSHPLASPLWLVISVIGLIGLLYSIRLVRIQQAELIQEKAERNAAEQKE
ncbi:MAG: hypothetical protein P1Q69_17540 [Candidatus Thorarchaeota archaeon]|nr:hypothetical protein [Candidatus Thorarchaeota archaeon]